LLFSAGQLSLRFVLFEHFRIWFLLKGELILGFKFGLDLFGKLNFRKKLDECCIFNIKLATATL
jgi:hypothetical protein